MPLETLAVVAQDVFMPLLASPANQQGWPDVVAKEVTENLHKFVSTGKLLDAGMQSYAGARLSKLWVPSLMTGRPGRECMHTAGWAGSSPAACAVMSRSQPPYLQGHCLARRPSHMPLAVFVTIGNMKGQTLLPLPPTSTVPQPTAEPSHKDQDKIHILESAIVTWTKQIKNVLKADPDAPLKASFCLCLCLIIFTSCLCLQFSRSVMAEM